MSYVSKRGRRPNEYASKSAHSHIINDVTVKAFIKECKLPPVAENVSLSDHLRLNYEPAVDNPIHHIIAVDGGFTEVPLRVEFPSATICFFQFGALTFSIDDLEDLGNQPFIDPEDVSKLKQIQRLKLTLPIRNVGLKSATSLTHSVRKALYDFFRETAEGESLMDTLRWFIFQEYGDAQTEWQLASCPICRVSRIPLSRLNMSSDYSFSCVKCGGEIYLTDVFRLHEAIDDEIGAGGILGYVSTTLEQIIIVHFIRLILQLKPALLDQILFIKDGPLAYFGQTANMHQPMRSLVRFLMTNHNLHLAGLEKSGPFVEHADEIAHKLKNGSILILDNDYIYKYILPGKADASNPYGRTTYYSNKIIFKTNSEDMHVVSLPTTEVNSHPKESDLHNLRVILTNVEKLKCDMYDSALVPIALVNKLVSLSNHPSSQILRRFAVDSLTK